MKKSITIQLEEHEIDMIKKVAVEDNRSVSSWIRLQILNTLTAKVNEQRTKEE